METTPRCNICQGDMKYIPAGISKKSGKPYDAFWSCKKYGCGGKSNVASDSAPSPSGYAKAQRSVANTVSDNVNRFEAKKEESMKTMAVGRDATLIVVAEMAQGKEWSEDDIKNRIKMYAAWIKETIYNPPFIG